MGAVMLKERNWGRLRWLGVPLAAALLTGCGDDAAQPANNTSDATTLSGSVFASYVNGASCQVVDTNGNVIAGPFTSSASGAYSIPLPDSHLAENLVVECSGGTFTDEATGTTQTAGDMKAYIAGGTASVGTAVHVTPSTTIITALIERHDMSATAAIDAFTSAFGFTPDYAVAPTDATNPAADASEARLLAGLRAATFSQLTKDLVLGPAEQFALFEALADDLANGALDGQSATGDVTVGAVTLPADIQNRFNRALVNFRDTAGGGRDASGLDNSKIGVLPFAKTAMTDNYKMTYVEGMHPAINGKTAFSIKVTDHNDVPVSGLNVSIDPLMNMDGGRLHKTTYNASCDEMPVVSGEYHCTVYYLMPSVMGMGEMARSMGYWQLAVTAGAETADFYPKVMMAMGDTAQVRLQAKSGDMDNVMAMGGGSGARTYYLYKQGLSGTAGNYKLDLFIATIESMMSFPAIATGHTLNAGTMHELVLNSIEVAVSTDGEIWLPLVEGAAGHWSINDLMLADNMQSTIYVKLTVNGDQKTAGGGELNNVPLDSLAPVNNHYAVFKLTPGGGMMHMPM